MENSGSHKSYRPLTTLSFRLNFLLSGLNPWPYHLTNVLLHTLTTWLFVHVARLVFCSKSCLYLNTLCNLNTNSSQVVTSRTNNNNHSANNGPFPSHHHHHSTKISGGGSCQRKGRFTEVTSSRNLAVLLSSLLFALHPIHTEAVAGLVGRADVGCTAFALLSFISYINFVKFRDKARINSAFIRNSRNYQNNHHHQYNGNQSSSSSNSSRSHSPLCPNKNKKAGINTHYENPHQQQQHLSENQLQNHYHNHHHPYSSSSCSNQLTGFGSLYTRFTNTLTSFSCFLLVRMKMFVVNKDEGEDVKSISSAATGMVTTTKASSDNGTSSSGTTISAASGNGYEKVKRSGCDRNNANATTTTTTATITSSCDDGSASSGVFGVSGIVGSVFGRGSAVICIFWLRCAVWFTAAVGFAAAAMLTKEQGITILLVCATYDLIRSLVRTRHLYQVSILASLLFLVFC